MAENKSARPMNRKRKKVCAFCVEKMKRLIIKTQQSFVVSLQREQRFSPEE